MKVSVYKISSQNAKKAAFILVRKYMVFLIVFSLLGVSLSIFTSRENSFSFLNLIIVVVLYILVFISIALMQYKTWFTYYSAFTLEIYEDGVKRYTDLNIDSYKKPMRFLLRYNKNVLFRSNMFIDFKNIKDIKEKKVGIFIITKFYKDNFFIPTQIEKFEEIKNTLTANTINL